MCGALLIPTLGRAKPSVRGGYAADPDQKRPWGPESPTDLLQYALCRSLYTSGPRARDFRARLVRWYGRHGRALPWRRTRDPYRILVSEVMLQQTPVARVVPAYGRFLRRFPTMRSLARATLGAVLVEWSGLGYPRRARDLHRAAVAGRGRVPRDVAGLDALPGVGAYTAGAVACFSTGAAVAFADTNIRRVLGRVLLGRTATQREAVELDAALIPPRDAARWHHALMDLGATVCLARAPRCDACPVRAACLAKGADPAPAVRRRAAFATSDRRVRGAIMKVLVARRRVDIRTLRKALPDRRVPRLLARLADEGLLTVASGSAGLPGVRRARASRSSRALRRGSSPSRRLHLDLVLHAKGLEHDGRERGHVSSGGPAMASAYRPAGRNARAVSTTCSFVTALICSG